MTSERPARRGPLLADQATTTIQTSTVEDDVYAWGAILLNDGRAISLAWLRNYPGAVAARWRR